MSAPFHLSICVTDLESTRAFYLGVVGCLERGSSSSYMDLSFYGNQLTCHVLPARVRPASELGLDGNHFGAILSLEEFGRLEARLQAAGVPFLNEPGTQHEGTPRERRRMIFCDPSGNAIEIKSADGLNRYG